MTDIMFTHTALTEAAKVAGVTTDQARTILEAAGMNVQPEPKPLPTEPGLYLHEDGRRIIVDKEGEWWYPSPEGSGAWWIEDKNRSGRLTPAVVVPATTTPVTLTDDQMGVLWDAVTASDPGASPWVDYSSSHRARFKAVANAVLDQYAAPAEGEPIDLGDVREGDRVRLVLVNGDEATITVEGVWSDSIDSPLYSFHPNNIRAAYLLDREEA